MRHILVATLLATLVACAKEVPQETVTEQREETLKKVKEENQNLASKLKQKNSCLQENQTFECACLKDGEATECLSYPGEQVTLDLRNKITQWATENCDEYAIKNENLRSSMDCR